MADALGTPGPPAGPGVVSALDHRLDQAGLIALQGPAALDVRTGVLRGPATGLLVTGTSATGTMTVNVAAHHWVTSRGAADGIYLGTKEASTAVNIAAAPGANSRIDVVYVKQNDSASTITPDGSTGEVYGVVTGTAAASPTKPALPVGALELATVQVAAGATATNGAGVTITNTARQTVARGGIIPVRDQADRDAITAYPAVVYRLDTGELEKHGLTGSWVPVSPTGRVGSLSTSAAGPSAVGGTETMFDSVTFTAVAGRRYRATWDGVWIANTALVTANFTIRSAAGASVSNTGALAHSRNVRSWATGEFIHMSLITEVTGLSSGTATVGIGARATVTAGGTISIPGAADNLRNTIVEDIGT